MKQTLKYILAFAVVGCAAQLNAATPYFTYRPTSVNAALELVGWQDYINLCDMECTYGSFYIAPGYMRTRKPGEIAQCIFGSAASCNDDCPATIKVQGSSVTNRDSGSWLADNFGLPTDYESTLNFEPEISNFFVDLNLYIGLDEWCDGLFFRIHAPITRTKWELNFCETDINKGTADHPAGYFGPDAVTRSNLLDSAEDFFTGNKAPTIPNGEDPQHQTGAVTFQTLQYSRFASTDCDELTETRLGDIEMALGYNWCCDEDYHIGLAIRASAPTGNDPCGTYLFEPIVGSGGHWKLGGGLTAHAMLWTSEDEACAFGVWLDANVQHLFETDQWRVFDLKNKPNSRYMLAQKLGTERAPLNLASAMNPTADAGVEFQNEYAPVANLTRQKVDVDVSVEGNLALKFGYMGECMQFDFGYEFYGRACEDICARCDCGPIIDGKSWALKGDAHVIGFRNQGADNDTAIRLAATQSGATICSGTNAGMTNPTTNPGIDSGVLANTRNSTDDGDVLVRATQGDTSELQTRSSVPPVFLKVSDIGLADATTRITSHKIFAHVSYAWTKCEGWTPFIGIGASYEFDGNGDKDCSTTSCSTTSDSCGTSSSCCQDCAVNQWAVWAKGGISFN